MPPQATTVAVPRRRSLETISMWALFLTLILTTFVVIPSAVLPSATTKTFLLAAGALLSLALFILARLSRGNIVLPPLALIGALWLPTLAYGLSSVFSASAFGNSLWGTALETDTLAFMLTAAVLATLTAFVLRRSEQYRSFLQTGALVFAAVAFIQVLILVVGQFAPGTVSPSLSILGSYEDLALFMGLGVLAILITFRFLELSKRAMRILIASGVAAMFVLAVANSSVVWVTLALVSLALFVESVMRRGPRSGDTDLDESAMVGDMSAESDEGNHSLVLPLVTLAVSLFFLVGGTLGGALAQGLHVNLLNIRPSWQATYDVAQKSYTTSPVFGSGPGTFGVQWLKYRDPSLNATQFWNIDFTNGIGFIPTSAVTTGVVGIIAWVAFLGLLIVFGLRMLILRAPEDPFIRYVAILSFVATIYLFVTAIFGLPNALVLTLAFVFAGLFVSTMRFATHGTQWGVIFSRSPRLGFVIVFSLTILLLASVVAAYTLVGRYVATSALASAISDFNKGNLDKATQNAQSAITFAPSATAYQVQAGVATAKLSQIAQSTTMPLATAQKAFQDSLSTGINAALTATRLAPNDYQNWLALANLYAQAVPVNVAGSYESSKAAFEKARALNPTNAQIPYLMAQLEIAHKDIKAAQEDLKQVIALKQDYTAAIFLLSQLYVQEGNVKDALASALAAAYFTPNNPNILFQVGVLYAAQNDFNNAKLALTAAVAANAQYANARYFLSAVDARLGDIPGALEQMQAIAAMSNENATAVASQLASLKAGKSPFPANLLTVAPSAPVKP